MKVCQREAFWPKYRRHKIVADDANQKMIRNRIRSFPREKIF